MSAGITVAGLATAAAGAAASAGISYELNKGKGGNAGQQGAAAADPFAAQRPQYQTALNTLMQGDFSSSDPSYKWRFDQGQEALQRGTAAHGMTRSGNEDAALVDYGQGQASTEYSNQFNRLSLLSGATNGSPAAAGQFLYNQGQSNQNAATAAGGQIGNAIGGAVGNYFNQPSSGGNVDMTGFQTQPTSSGFFDSASGTGNTYAPGSFSATDFSMYQ